MPPFAQKLDVDGDFPQHLTAAFDGLYTMALFWRGSETLLE